VPVRTAISTSTSRTAVPRPARRRSSIPTCSPRARAIFDRPWLYLGHESEVAEPGDFRARELGLRRIVFVRGKDRVVRALLNSCTHRGAEVCRERRGNAKSFQCFYHGWTFSNEGG
jgi:p-cumate 2,3-dioxygenase alpha subunit